MSNIGGKEIAMNLLDLYSQGIKRNEVEFHNFEPIIRRISYSTGMFFLITTGLYAFILPEVNGIAVYGL